MTIEVVPLSNEHVIKISAMHIQYLRSPFHNKSGERMLQAYYSTLIKQKGGCGYVAVSDDGVSGYVCGIWEPVLVNKTLIQDQWKSLLIASLQTLIQSPKLIVDLFFRFIKKNKKKNDISLEGYELRPIVVDEKFRGSDAGPLLVSALVMDAKKRGYSSIFLLTEEDNVPANKFYQKVGFERKEILVKSKQNYILYKRGL